MLKFIPVRGRKRHCAFCLANFSKLKFIPVRGRKQRIALGQTRRADVEIYPRVGTETIYRVFVRKKVVGLKFIPVRGRKPSATNSASPDTC